MKSKPSPDTPQKKSWRVLAGELQTTDRSLRLWRGRPGAPKVPDAQQWRAYMAGEGLGRPRSGELTELKALLLREQIAAAKRRNDRESGQLLPMDTLGDELRARSAGFGMLLRHTLENDLPPKLLGQPIAEIRRVMAEANLELISRYNSKNYFAPDAVAEATLAADKGEN
jgi:hypothetical protein